MKLHKSRFQQAARVELLPLIDVIFLLLIFFIFVMLKMTVQSSIKVELPQAVDSMTQTKTMLTINIDAHSQIFVNEETSSLQDVLGQVQLLEQQNSLPILIRGDRQANLGVALTLLDKLRLGGFEQVTFATEKDQAR
ncbi:ExbD/TolR family protein [Psychromonas antarctica]|uniref:ExbD/TolR family protein n=1 Tax=Psychromonas antarctica TaxID=67573 RepID=UPI001EE864E5|nr:biopolymer transporter ExbD [Psychromonas antarctica]MCG6201635.1 biopolymer transporter ExbD [Psychromonas antarctica]